ncbi:MAG: DUF3828 domain-containing protein [Terracidiphilus sp.]
MRARLLLTLALSAAALFEAARAPAQNPVQAPAQDPAPAKAFLVSVYRHYQSGGIGIDTVGPHVGLYFHSSLVALFSADQKAASPDVGAIDGDPICACQDWDGIWDLKIDVHFDTPERAKAAVSFALSAPKDRPKDSLRKLEFTLAQENGEWRIYDIVDRSDPAAPFALRKALQADIDSHRH